MFQRVKPIGFDPEEGIKCLLYGRSGTGKTTMWGTFPGPILALVCSGGNRAGELRSLDTPHHKSKVSQLVVENSAEVLEVATDPQVTKYQTVVLDHASGLQDRVLAEILGMDELPAQMSWGTATQQQYGQCTLQCKEILRKLLALRGNVVIIAQERAFNDEGGSDLILPSVGAGLTPSLTGWLNTAVDYICQTFIRQKVEKVKEKMAGKEVEKEVQTDQAEYCLRTAPHAVYTTKFRVPRGSRPIPDVIPDPDYHKLMKLIRG